MQSANGQLPSLANRQPPAALPLWQTKYSEPSRGQALLQTPATSPPWVVCGSDDCQSLAMVGGLGGLARCCKGSNVSIGRRTMLTMQSPAARAGIEEQQQQQQQNASDAASGCCTERCCDSHHSYLTLRYICQRPLITSACKTKTHQVVTSFTGCLVAFALRWDKGTRGKTSEH